jgi:hypothetical protein
MKGGVRSGVYLMQAILLKITFSFTFVVLSRVDIFVMSKVTLWRNVEATVKE